MHNVRRKRPSVLVEPDDFFCLIQHPTCGMLRLFVRSILRNPLYIAINYIILENL